MAGLWQKEGLETSWSFDGDMVGSCAACGVFRERMECKVWIENGIEIAWNRGFVESEINDILRMIGTHLKLINETYEQLLA